MPAETGAWRAFRMGMSDVTDGIPYHHTTRTHALNLPSSSLLLCIFFFHFLHFPFGFILLFSPTTHLPFHPLPLFTGQGQDPSSIYQSTYTHLRTGDSETGTQEHSGTHLSLSLLSLIPTC